MKKLLILLFPVVFGCAPKLKSIYWVDCPDGNRYRCPQPKPCKCPDEGIRQDRIGENADYYSKCPPDDTTAVTQEVFFSRLLNKYVLVTNMGSMYDAVLFHESKEFLEMQKFIEYNNALRRKKPVATIDIRCN